MSPSKAPKAPAAAPANPPLNGRNIILALLESAGKTGATAQEIAKAGNVPEGTISSALTTLAYQGEIHCLNLGKKPRRYVLPRHGGQAFSPAARGKKDASALGAELRIVVSIGSERKSLTFAEARMLFASLEKIFRANPNG